MPLRKAKTRVRTTIVARVHANIVLPADLHEAMKKIRQIRQDREGSDVKLSRLYREAVEQYIAAKAQQEMLREWEEANGTKASRAPFATAV